MQDLTYDPLRRLLTEQTKIGSNPAVTSQLYYGSDEDQPTASLSSAGWERYVADADGMMLAVSNAGGASLQMRDLLGDVVATIDVGATVPTMTVDYSTYGERRGTTGTIPNDGLNLGWKGGYGKNTAFTPGGFIHMGARVYNPTSGRFLQLDPVVNGSANPYDYANQDPLNQMDLNGLCAAVLHASLRGRFATWHLSRSCTQRVNRMLKNGAAMSVITGAICGAIKFAGMPGGLLGWAISVGVGGACGLVTYLVQRRLKSVFGPAVKRKQCVTLKLRLGLNLKLLPIELNRSRHRTYCIA